MMVAWRLGCLGRHWILQRYDSNDDSHGSFGLKSLDMVGGNRVYSNYIVYYMYVRVIVLKMTQESRPLAASLH